MNAAGLTKRRHRTLRRSVTFEGIGLHTGKRARLAVHPATSGTGIRFLRADLPGRPEIPAGFQNVRKTQLATTLVHGDASVMTVEHLMAALYGMGITNALLELDGAEVPILDGSSEPFFREFSRVGFAEDSAPMQVLVIDKPFQVRIDEKWAMIEPFDGFEIDVTIEWDHPTIGFQSMRYREGTQSFREISASRTFCLLRDVEKMKSMGLALGGSLENAVVLSDSGVLNPDGLRFHDEFVRHKVLDCVGDFWLAGIPILGRFKMHRPGHQLHSMILEELFSNTSLYRVVEVSGESVETLEPALAAVASAMPLRAATGF